MKKLAAAVVVVVIAALHGTASASPLDVKGEVRDIQRVGNLVWVAGGFDGLVATYDLSGNRLPIAPHLRGTKAYRLSYSNGEIAVAGEFTSQKGSHNLVILDALTGSELTSFNVRESLKSVLLVGDRVYAGGTTLGAWNAQTGQPIPGWDGPRVRSDAGIRGYSTGSGFRDLVAGAGVVYGACQCEHVTWNGTTSDSRALLRIDADTGKPLPWPATGTLMIGGILRDGAPSEPFGITLLKTRRYLYLAAGGSDATWKFTLSGEKVWKEDTAGSSQSLALVGHTLYVGGHFRNVAPSPKDGVIGFGIRVRNAIWQPKLVKLDAITGAVAWHKERATDGKLYKMANWHPAICCEYNGSWALAWVDGRLWVGGQFDWLGTAWRVNHGKFTTLGAVVNPTHAYNLTSVRG